MTERKVFRERGEENQQMLEEVCPFGREVVCGEGSSSQCLLELIWMLCYSVTECAVSLKDYCTVALCLKSVTRPGEYTWVCVS